MKYRILDLQWETLGLTSWHKIMEFCLLTLLQDWEDTPYMDGQQCKHVGVDCLQFAVAIYQELLGKPIERVPALSGDACIHNRQKSQEALKTIRRLFPESFRIQTKTVKPGDIIVTGPPCGGPGHVMIVGPEPYTLWHTTERTGVCKTGFALPVKYQKVFGVYRLRVQ